MADASVGAIDRTLPVLFALAPVVLGGAATYFNIFLTSKEDFRNRARLERSALMERLAGKLAALCQHVRALTADECLRGDGRETPDLVGDYAEENLRVFTVYHRLAVLETVVRYAYMSLYVSVVLGIGGLLLAALLPPAGRWVLSGAIGVVAVQVVIVFIVQLAAWKLQEYEDVV